jgi:hypothetical protein
LLAAVFPFNPTQLGEDKNPAQPDWAKYRAAFAATVPPSGGAERFLADPQLAPLVKTGTRILTENAYAQAVLANAASGCDLVPIWSPEVAFLFDRSLNAKDQQRRLRALNITLLLLYPGSPNTKYLVESSPFYHDAVHEPEPGKLSVGWPVIVQAPGLPYVICAIPPAD